MTMPAKPITHQMLEAVGACQGQVTLFKKLFPDGAPLTIEAALSVADKFNWGWAADKFLSKKGWKAYDDARTLALKAYEEADALAWEACGEAKTTGGKSYWGVMVPAWKAYSEARALAFATAYLNDQKEE